VKAIAFVFSCLALLAAACSAGAGSGATEPPSQAPTLVPSQAPTVAPSQAPTATPTATEMAGGLTITVMQSSLGAYLVGPNGHALYVLTNDSANTSTCTDSCAQAWPPLLVTSGQSAQPGDGVTGAVGTFTRPDGGTQVSVGGMPVYYFSGDTAADQTSGQGVGGIWFLATPDGKPLSGSASVPSSPMATSASESPQPTHVRY
jgi:predicted lipoprotein with Yx(FWY)xxD motif